MAGKLFSNRVGVIEALKKGLLEIGLKNAGIIEANSNQTILTNTGRVGQGLGPGDKETDLAASSYIVTAKKSGYEAAKKRAGPGRSGRFAPPATVIQGDTEVKVKVAYALERALPLHSGYYNPQTDRLMLGTPFLASAARGQFQDYKADVAGLLTTLNTVSVIVPSEAAREAEKEEKAFYRKERKENPNPYDEFGSAGQFFKAAGVPHSRVEDVIQAMDAAQGKDANFNKVLNNRRNRGKQHYQPTPFNPQSGHKKQRIFDAQRNIIRFEYDHEYIERIERYFENLDAGVNYNV